MEEEIKALSKKKKKKTIKKNETICSKLLTLVIFICGLIIIFFIILIIIFRKSLFLSNNSPNIISWEEAYQKASQKLKEFNITEKLSLIYGIQNLLKSSKDGGCIGAIEPIKDKFPGMCLQDGPSGARFTPKTTSWQAPINTASTFNKSLMYIVGKAQGQEFKNKGINVILGPAMNMQRSPLGGRIWESYGDDPFLSGVCATHIIKGIQSNGVIACAKHYVGNDQETNRRGSSSNIPEQALWEIYIEPFYRSVKDADVGSIMSAYNAVNGTFCVNNSRLVQDYLKNIIGFKGFVMTDWWAIRSNDPSNFNNGVDMNMPGGKRPGFNYTGRNKSHWSDFEKKIGKEIKEERLNDAVKRILASMYKLGQLNDNEIYKGYPKINLLKNTTNEKNKKLNRQAATQSNVLLKNENSILPLKNLKGKTIAIIGNDAIKSNCLKIFDCSCISKKNKIFKGHMALGYGSGTTTFDYLIDPLTAIKIRAEKKGINVIYSGNITNETEIIKNRKFIVGKEDILGAKEVAKKADICIIFLNADSGEDFLSLEKSIGDRYDLNAWHSGNELVNAVLEINSNVIVVINAPGPINLPWLDKIKGLIFSGFGGAESGNGIADVLFGYYNPSGHLPFIWAKNENYPSQINILNRTKNYDYNEGVFIGQRYFDKFNKEYIFPFGYGLSYTKFEFNDDIKALMNKEGLNISFSIKNIGKMQGEVVPMVFLKFPDEIETENGYPDKLFKGFDKKWIRPNESVEFNIFVDDHALSYYNVNKKCFVRPNQGKYEIFLGFDAKNYNLKQTFVNANY